MLDRILEDGKFAPEEIKHVWRERGWLDVGDDRKRYTKKVSIFGEKRWLVTLDLMAAAEDEDDKKREEKEDPLPF